MSTRPKHIGNSCATNIQFIKNGNFNEYQRIIGKIKRWNGQFGFISSEQLDEEVFAFHTRLINKKASVQTGELVIFNPIKSTKGENELFAFFFYPLKDENDIDFLRNLFRDSQVSEIGFCITELIQKKKDTTPEQKFELEVMELSPIDTQMQYQSLVKIIKNYKKNFKFKPSIRLLKQHVPPKYQILLWENRIINEFDIEIMKEYFHRTTANQKRFLAEKFEPDKYYLILTYHIQQLTLTH